MKVIATALWACVVVIAQSGPPRLETRGACSPVVTGNGNSITIKTCGMTDAQVREWRASLRQILEKQVDPRVLVALLDDIKKGQIRLENGVLRIERSVEQLRSGQGWLDLTREEMREMAEALRRFGGQDALIDVPFWERDTERLAKQFAEVLASAGWTTRLSGQGETRWYPPSAKLPSGIVISRKIDTPAFLALFRALQKVYGQGTLWVHRDSALSPDQIKVTIWRKP